MYIILIINAIKRDFSKLLNKKLGISQNLRINIKKRNRDNIIKIKIRNKINNNMNFRMKLKLIMRRKIILKQMQIFNIK